MTNAWDKLFGEHGQYFTEPHEDMPAVVDRLKSMNADKVLDLGCGSGRHTVYLAQNGFSVHGLDGSPNGIEIARQLLAEESLSADFQLQNMTERLPYDDDFFDAVISIQVIHHERIAAVKDVISEIHRVLKSAGLAFITVPELREQAIEFEEIESGTFVPLDGQEAGLPHHYFTQEELREAFSDFDVEDIHHDATRHYCLTAVKP